VVCGDLRFAALPDSAQLFLEKSLKSFMPNPPWSSEILSHRFPFMQPQSIAKTVSHSTRRMLILSPHRTPDPPSDSAFRSSVLQSRGCAQLLTISAVISPHQSDVPLSVTYEYQVMVRR